MKKIILPILFFTVSAVVLAQTDLVTSEGITSALHQANIGKITFMAQTIPLENYQEADFLKTFELRETGDLNIRVLWPIR